jgi:hypothetical protein
MPLTPDGAVGSVAPAGALVATRTSSNAVAPTASFQSWIRCRSAVRV